VHRNGPHSMIYIVISQLAIDFSNKAILVKKYGGSIFIHHIYTFLMYSPKDYFT